MTDILNSILAIKSDAQVSVNAEDINQITWHDGTAPISKEDIEAMIPTVEAEMEQKKTDASTGKQKLKDLGLDDDEIKALMGA